MFSTSSRKPLFLFLQISHTKKLNTSLINVFHCLQIYFEKKKYWQFVLNVRHKAEFVMKGKNVDDS